MSGFPGKPSILKGALVYYANVGLPPRVIVFPYNPDTLIRTILPGPPATAESPKSPAAGAPLETIVFTLTLDAADALATSDPTAVSKGVYPVLSAIELLMYPEPRVWTPVTVFVWGPNRIVPVRVAALNIVESQFSPTLSPIHATVQVTLNVTTVADTAQLGYLVQHIDALNVMGMLGYTAAPTTIGVKFPLPGGLPPASDGGTTGAPTASAGTSVGTTKPTGLGSVI